MSDYITIYEVRRGRQHGTFRIQLPNQRNALDSHILQAVHNNNPYTFVRCSCRNGQQCYICAPNRSLTELMQQFNNDNVPNVTVNIAEAVENALRTNDVSALPEYKAEETLEECAICMEKIKKRQKFRALECSETIYHKFHSKCIDKWVKNHNSCPVCRAKVF